MQGMGTWKRTSGVSYEGTPIHQDMIFSLGSNTKTYTAVVILKLHQEGFLNIDDTIGKWITPTATIKGDITIKQLLNHTSGLASYTDNEKFWDTINSTLSKKWQPEEIIAYVESPLFAPGSSWAYSNTNFLLAGIIITKVMNTSLANAYATYIFNPLELNHTVLATEQTTSLEFAHRWSVNIGYPYQADWDALGLDYTAMNSVSWAAGGLYATAEDNVKFFDGLLNRKILLADSMLAKLQTTVNIGSGARYGLGIFAFDNFNGRTVWSHGGSNVGANNENIYDPICHCSVSLLTNQDSVENNDLILKAIHPLHKIMLSLGTGAREESKASSLLVNIYPNPSPGATTVSVKEAALFELYNHVGQLVMKQELAEGDNLLHVQEASGIYFYSVRLMSGATAGGNFIIKN